jgi:hypothetical protein
VAVGDDRADAAQAVYAQVTRELTPEGIGFSPDHDADDFPAVALSDAGGNDHGLVHDAVVGRVRFVNIAEVADSF